MTTYRAARRIGRYFSIKPNDERWALIKDYADNYNTMTDAQAQDYIKRSTDVDEQLLALPCSLRAIRSQYVRYRILVLRVR